MTEYHPLLKEIFDVYYITEKNKHYIENKTAIVMTNAKYVENLRHSISHLMEGLKLEFESGDAEKINEQFTHAKKHLNDLDVNGYEYLAGLLLTRVREAIERAGFFVNINNAEPLHQEALDHFEMGRNTRTENKEKAMQCFGNTIDLCQQALRVISPIHRREKTLTNISIGSFIIAIISTIIAIFALHNAS